MNEGYLQSTAIACQHKHTGVAPHLHHPTTHAHGKHLDLGQEQHHHGT